MKKLLCVLLFALPLSAADFEIGMRHVAAFSRGDSGELDIPLSRGFAATGEVFWTESIATQFAASFVNPEAILFPVNAEPIDLGTLGLDIYSVSARYHFAPRARLSGYLGAGAAFVSIGNLDDQFGDAIYAELGSDTTVLAEAGLRYRLLDRLYAEVGVMYLPIGAEPEATRGGSALPAEVNVDPLIVSAGLAWRF